MQWHNCINRTSISAQIKIQPFPIPIFHSIGRKCTSFTSNIWLPKPHPVQSNTFELMDVCFSTSSQLFNTEFCECKQKEFILVQKCSSKEEREDFYVYRLFPALSDKKTSSDSLNRCELRYCADIKPGCVSLVHVIIMCTIWPSFNPKILFVLIVNPWKLLLFLCNWIW